MPVLPRMQQIPETGGFRALSQLAARVLCAENRASCTEQGVPLEDVQESLWKQFFADPTQWCDNRRSKPTPRHPDFRHKQSMVALWLNSQQKPAWVDLQLALWDGMKSHPDSVSTPVIGQHEDHIDIEMYRILCADGRITEAVDALNLLVQQGCHVPNNLYYHVLRRCITHKDLVQGRRIHILSIRSGYEGDAFLGTHLIALYASHRRLEEAMRVFSNVCVPSSYNWATIIFAYARHGEAAQAIRLYRQMHDSTTVKPTDRIFVAVLKACATAGDLKTGKEVHAHILASLVKPNIFVQNGLVNMYANCGKLEDARSMFDKLPEKDVVTWNSMIAGYVQQGMGQEALRLYSSMQLDGLNPPSPITFVCLLQACAIVGVEALDHGKQLHVQTVEQGLQGDMVVGNSLVSMYAKCGSLEEARNLFDRLRERNVVTWNAMIAGYVQQGMGQEALCLYSSMIQEAVHSPNAVTFAYLVQACGSVGVSALLQGKQLHALIVEQRLQADVVLVTCLVDMYAKCGSLEDARDVFDRMPNKDVVTWNVMLAVYVQQGLCQEALTLYNKMQQAGFSPNSVTFVCLLHACATLAALSQGKQLHAKIEERGLQADVVLGAALVNMYAKCGSMSESQQLFDSLPERTIEAWGALTSGYTRHGQSEVVFDLLERMRMEGIQPNGIVFLSVLTVCSHVGLVDKGRNYFDDMRTAYGICPTVDHYTCMIDLLGRAGHLDEALQMAKTMPFSPNTTVWLTLLGACQKWNNVEIGQQAFEFAVRVDGKVSSSYVLMANIYATAQMWDEVKEMQERRVKSGAWKKPGQSWWTDMGGVVHTFVVGDRKRPGSEARWNR